MSISGNAENAVLVAARFAFFFASRKYLLRTLYSDLRSIYSWSGGASAPGTPTTRNGGVNGHPGATTTPTSSTFELNTLGDLPTPVSAPKSGRFSPEDTTYLHAIVSRTLFSWCFAECCMMFLLLMMQSWGVFSAATRLTNWHFSLFFLMAAILVVIPLSLSLLLALGPQRTSDPHARKFLTLRITISLIPVLVYLFLISYIPLPPSLDLEDSDLTAAFLSRLIVIGTVVLGLLSGFGAVSSSWAFLPSPFGRGGGAAGVPSAQDVETATYALTSIRRDLRTRRAEAQRREGSVGDATWFSRVGSTFRGSDSLTQEIQGLEALEYQMSRNLESLRERHEAGKFAGTFRGRLFNVAGKMFAVYCVLRIVSSIYNILSPTKRSSSSTTYPDLLTEALAYLVSRFSANPAVTHDDLASISRQISLVLVGVIILSSIRLVLRGATRVLRVTSRNLAASLMLLVLALIMGIYLLSTLVQMRSSFPPPPPSPSDPVDAHAANLFSTIPEYEVFGSLFDWSFLVAAGSLGVVRWGQERVNGRD